MADSGDIPTIESVVGDLREIVRDGIERFSLERLKALHRLDSLRPQADHSPNVLSVKKALIKHILHLDPDWKRNSALALLGMTSQTQSVNLVGRRQAAGELWNPPVAGSTFRAPENGENRIISELAAALLRDALNHQEHGLEAERPLSDRVRSRVSIEFEQRLGYRWTRYRRAVRWDEKDLVWHNQLSLEIEALRPGVRIVEYDYIGPRFVIAGAPTVEPKVRSSSAPSYLSSVSSEFHSRGHYRARFDLGRELVTNERVTLAFSYHFAWLPRSHPTAPSFGVTVPFDRMELVELAFVPTNPEASIVSAYRQYLLGPIVYRQWDSIITEDRLADGSYTGIFTAPCADPFTGVTYSIELVELEKTNFRKILDEVKQDMG
jgi:hypothetical protein